MHHSEFAFEGRCVCVRVCVFVNAQHSTSGSRRSLCVTSWVPSEELQNSLLVCVWHPSLCGFTESLLRSSINTFLALSQTTYPATAACTNTH